MRDEYYAKSVGVFKDISAGYDKAKAAGLIPYMHDVSQLESFITTGFGNNLPYIEMRNFYNNLCDLSKALQEVIAAAEKAKRDEEEARRRAEAERYQREQEEKLKAKREEEERERRRVEDQRAAIAAARALRIRIAVGIPLMAIGGFMLYKTIIGTQGISDSEVGPYYFLILGAFLLFGVGSALIAKAFNTFLIVATVITVIVIAVTSSKDPFVEKFFGGLLIGVICALVVLLGRAIASPFRKDY